MKKKLVIVLPILAMLLTACGADPASSENSSQDLPESQDSSEHVDSSSSSEDASSSEDSSSSETSSSETIDEEITLKTFGHLHLNSFKNIYATLKNGTKDEIVWKSSDDKVVSVFARDGLSEEAFLTGEGYGTATITASLKNHPEIKCSQEFTIAEGHAMPATLFNKISGAMKVNSDEYFSTYTLDHVETVEEHYQIETIYEENNPNLLMTDAYSLYSKNANTQEVDANFAFVRNEDSLVSIESLNPENKVDIIPVTKDKDKIPWEASEYPNLLGSTTISNKDFRTFDGGQTYYFVGDTVESTKVITSIIMSVFEPDDFYFTNNNGELTLTAFLEPFRMDPKANYRDSRKVVCHLSEFGTAKIDHVKPYPTNPEHAKLEKALEVMRKGNNYTVDYDLKVKGGDNKESQNVYKFTKDDIYHQLFKHGTLDSVTGYHHTTGDAYYNYKALKDTEGNFQVYIVKNYETGWNNKLTILPSFNFASEIFHVVEGQTNTYESIEGAGSVISRSLLLDPYYKLFDFNDKARVTLSDDGSLQTISTDLFNEKDNSTYVLTANFKDIATTVIPLDFENAKDVLPPQSWEEENPALYKELKAWKVDTVLPFLHAKNGYKDYTGKHMDSAYNTIGCYLHTENFDTVKERDAFIAAYKEVLVEAGFVATGRLDTKFGYELYKKGTYSISVGAEKNRGKPIDSVVISIFSPTIEEPESYFD